MSGFLFSEVVFGPIISRRLGISLGINLLPTKYKVCNFNCIYCECGWNQENGKKSIKLPERSEIREVLLSKLRDLKKENSKLDAITFAGNGEPSIHPEFDAITKDVIELRDEFFPDAKTTLLSNACLLSDNKVLDSIKMLDNIILKLDAGTDKTFHLINRSAENIHLSDIVSNLKKFNGNLIIQTLFLRGIYKSDIIDNTTEEELENWLNYIKEINPKYVMIYPVNRATPADNIQKISRTELEIIAERVKSIGVETKVYD